MEIYNSESEKGWNPQSITKKELRFLIGVSRYSLSKFINHVCIKDLENTHYKINDIVLYKETLDILFPQGIYKKQNEKE